MQILLNFTHKHTQLLSLCGPEVKQLKSGQLGGRILEESLGNVPFNIRERKRDGEVWGERKRETDSHKDFKN